MSCNQNKVALYERIQATQWALTSVRWIMDCWLSVAAIASVDVEHKVSDWQMKVQNFLSEWPKD